MADANPPPVHALLLDLDGTLVDTLGFLFDAFRHAVEPFVSRLPTNAEVIATFGPAEPECIARYLRRAEVEGFALSPASAATEEAVRRFFRFYEAGHDEVRAFAGMLELVAKLNQTQRPVGIFTGKGRRGAEYTLQKLGLWPGGVQCLVSSDDVARSKPDPEGVRQALEQLAVRPEEMLFVGDAPADIAAGRAAGVRTAAALWGCFDPRATLAENPTYALQEVAELRRLLQA